MPTYDSRNARCLVFTFKEGLLSPVAHDLRLVCERFSVHVDDGLTKLEATFEPGSLRVDVAMRDGQEDRSALNAGDKQQIEKHLREEVLHVGEFPQASFRSTSVSARADGGYDVRGELTLHGVTRPLELRSRLADGKQTAEVSLHQPDFGIVPYRAMLGTLKIQPRVVVQFELTTPAAPATGS